ncbi:hypothetical protein D3C76_1131740 [compost metagenome]
MGRFSIVMHQDFNAVPTQRGDIAIELGKGLELNVFSNGCRTLEAVVRRRVLIEGETCRANH